ncbi:unnamed protein product, partial [Gulo gulo]
ELLQCNSHADLTFDCWSNGSPPWRKNWSSAESLKVKTEQKVIAGNLGPLNNQQGEVWSDCANMC